MLDILTAALFIIFLLTSPHPILFVIMVPILMVMIHAQLWIVFGLPHRRRRGGGRNLHG